VKENIRKLKMKVKQLKEILADMADETLVVLATDAEGNEFFPVGSYNKDMKYIPDRHPWQRGQLCQADEAEFSNNNARPALVLWPTH
jgi:hypothetical protein